MKKIITVITAMIPLFFAAAQNGVGINTLAPHSKSALDITSSSKGLLVPRITGAARAAMFPAADATAKGMLVYQTDGTAGFYCYDGNAWAALNGNGNAFNLPFVGEQADASTLFKISNSGTGDGITAESNGGTALRASSIGWGTAISVGTDKGFGVMSITNDTGIAIYGLSQRGNAAKFEIQNQDNKSPVVKIKNNGMYADGISIENNWRGTGISMNLKRNASGIRIYDTTENTGGQPGSPAVFVYTHNGNAVWGITKSYSSVGVYGLHENHGEAVIGITESLAGSDLAAITGRNDGPAAGVRGFSTVPGGIGILGQSGRGGANNVAGLFTSLNQANTTDVLQVTILGNATNNLLVLKKGNSNIARIDHTGKAFFNGGTQNSGADIAEAFDVEGNSGDYEPGDVLVISVDKNRTVTKSSSAYSALVAGVYATKPGVLLTEENIDSGLAGKIPMGVIGVLPTKVCIEGGPIKKGDMLVASSVSGTAMKADIDKVRIGQVIGKALEDFDAAAPGRIRVLVSIK